MTRQHNHLPHLLQECRILLLEPISPSQGPCWLPKGKVGIGRSSSNEAMSEAGLFVALPHGLAVADGSRAERWMTCPLNSSVVLMLVLMFTQFS